MKLAHARHFAFLLAAASGVLAFGVLHFANLPLAYRTGTNVFFVAYIALVLWQLPAMTPDYLRKHARSADLPVFVIIGATTLIVGISVASLLWLINARTQTGHAELLFSLASIPLGWFTIQAMEALHYAHIYWSARHAGTARQGHGLDFPGDEPPSGFDFLYFSATIGMTAQTADVGIVSPAMRRAVLVHAVLSFFFNAVIVAAAVNVAVAYGG